MSHTFKFVVTVEASRSTGKFAGREEMAEAIRDEIEGADPSTLYNLGADGDSEYEIDSWTVEDA